MAQTGDEYRAAEGISGAFLPANLKQAPLQALPIDTTPGAWVDAGVEGDPDALARMAGYDDDTDWQVPAVPLIGAVDLAGDILVAITVSVPANGWIDVGELNTARPSAIQLVLLAAAVGLEIQGINTGTSSAAGFPIPTAAPLIVHSRAAHVHNTTGAGVNLAYMLIALGTP